MEAILSFFRELKESNNEVFSKVTSDGAPDSQKLRMYLNENSIDCKGSNMFSLVRAFSESLKTNTNTNTTNPEKKEKKEKQEQEQKELHEQKEELEKEVHEKNEQKEQKEELKKRFSKLNFDPVSVQSLSFEFEVLHGVFKAGRPDESRQTALEDAHIKCDQALDWIIEIKNSTDDFAAVIGGVTYAADTPSLANALFELYLQLH
jgi:predicted nuclease with TOPRIM domain